MFGICRNVLNCRAILRLSVSDTRKAPGIVGGRCQLLSTLADDATSREPGKCRTGVKIKHRCYGTKKHSSKSLNYKPVNVSDIMAESGWMEMGGFSVYPWSISGLETCVVVDWGQKPVAFDMGYPFRAAVKCQNVFISHGHVDHTAGIVKHAAIRSLYSMKPATYYVPSHLVEPIRTMCQGYRELHGDSGRGDFCQLNLKTVDPGQSVMIPGGRRVEAFPTIHRVPSQGYIVYQQKKKLKPEYEGLDGREIGQLASQGVEVNDLIETPEVAYTGDTTFEIFENLASADLLRVKLLIVEATYIDNEVDKRGKTAEERARERGHIHLKEITDNESLFKDVEHIVLVHMSDKYSTRYMKTKVDSMLPDSLRNKVHLGTQLKELSESYS